MGKKVRDHTMCIEPDVVEISPPVGSFTVHVDSYCVGFFDLDSIHTRRNGHEIQLCFPKSENIEQYGGQDITVYMDGGLYHVWKE